MNGRAEARRLAERWLCGEPEPVPLRGSAPGMAAGPFAGAAVWERSSAANPGRRRWAARGREEDAEEAPAVLVLSHFCRPPFLAFGSLRVGASRTRLLGIDNPNAEDAEVVVDRFPASARGFSIEHRRFAVQVPGGGGWGSASARRTGGGRVVPCGRGRWAVPRAGGEGGAGQLPAGAAGSWAAEEAPPPA